MRLRYRFFATLSLAGVVGLGIVPARAAVRLGLGSLSYFNPGSISRGEISYPSVSVFADLRRNNSDVGLQAGAQLRLEQFVDRELPAWFDVPEAYLGYRFLLGGGSTLELEIGRAREEWSQSDRRFNLGIWEPLYRSDYVRPWTAGLSGLFVRWKGEGVSVTAFASPMFVPERGSPIEASGGSLRSQSPWFVSPPSRVDVLGADTPVLYELAVPPLLDVVSHAGGAVHARVGGEAGAWASASYGYKPVNRLLLAYEGYLDLSRMAVVTTLHPRVVYHHLASVDAGWRSSRTQLAASFTAEAPERDRTPDDWNTQEIRAARIYSLMADQALAGDLREGLRVEAGALHVSGGNAQDRGPYASGGTVFETRYPFRHAALAGLRATLGRLAFGGRALYDLPREISLVALDASWAAGNGWTLFAGADLLGSGESPDVAARSGNAVSTYRANDRVSAGVTYAF